MLHQCGSAGREAGLDEPDRIGPEAELAIPGLGRRYPGRLALRIDVPQLRSGGERVDRRRFRNKLIVEEPHRSCLLAS